MLYVIDTDMKKILSLPRIVLIFIAFLMMNTGCRKNSADLLLYNGLFYNVNGSFDIAEAMVIKSGRIVALGKSSELKRNFNVSESIDLQNKPVYPGFIDSHCHFYEYGLNQQKADLTATTSQEEIVALLQKHQRQFPASWIIGHGWDQNDWSNKEFPHKNTLDKEFADIPVYLVRIDGHAAWVNTKALEIAGINSTTRSEGGEILTDQNGPTGILIDNAMGLVEKFIPAPQHEEKVRALIKAEQNCFGVGLTSVCDAGLNREAVLLIDSLQKAGLLKIRIYAMLHPSKENILHFVNQGPYQTERLNVRSLKLFVDGALGSRGALLTEPYSDDPSNRGLQVTPTSELNDICKIAIDKGYQVNTHCIGDSAIRLMLNIYSRFLPEHNDLRWRIEHSQVLDPDDISLYAQYAVIPSIQTTHATSDMYWAEDRLGPHRIRYAYAYKTLLEQNGWLPNGSDFPVESINPIYGFYAAITRKDLKGFPEEGFQKQEALTRDQALKSMTIWAAKACFEEEHKGSLEPGKYADFVVLDNDIMNLEENEIPKVKVLKTFVNGVQVF
jgi:predicted amidohydrolase YtcJ